VLAAHILRRIAAHAGGEPQRLSAAALESLRAHDFPGNVRELENILERATALSEAPVLDVSDLRLPQAHGQSQAEPRVGADLGPATADPSPPQAPHGSPSTLGLAGATAAAPGAGSPDIDIGDRPLEAKLDEIEKLAILKALDSTHWNRTAAAKLLGMTPRSLRYRLGKLGLD
jgi:two-component system response regulator PilR (NtrC family)